MCWLEPCPQESGRAGASPGSGDGGAGERGPSRGTRGRRGLLDGFGGILFADEHL